MKTTKTTSSKSALNSFASNEAPAMQAKTLNNWRTALQLAMRGNLWYMHCDERSGVTRDPSISEWIEFDVLCASTLPAKKMLAHGYEKVTGKNYAVLLHTLLKLSESKFTRHTANSFSVQYNRHVYNR